MLLYCLSDRYARHDADSTWWDSLGCQAPDRGDRKVVPRFANPVADRLRSPYCARLFLDLRLLD